MISNDGGGRAIMAHLFSSACTTKALLVGALAVLFFGMG